MKNLILLVILSSFLVGIKNTNTLENKYYDHVRTFNSGFNTEEGIIDLYNELDDLTDDIEDELEENESRELEILLKKSEAVKSFVGEIGPSGSNFDLTLNKFNIAISELDIDFYWYDKYKYCLKIIKFSIWDDTYESILLFNDHNCMYTFNSQIIVDYIENTQMANITNFEGGVDGNSVRAMESKFIKENRPLLLDKLTCSKTDYCK